MVGPVISLRTFRSTQRSTLVVGLALLAALAGAACTSEEPTAIDFSADAEDVTTTLAAHTDGEAAIPDPENDPNAGQRSMVFGLAEQQCLDDPELAEGVIQIAVPDTGEVVNEVTVECGEVRERAEAGEPAGVELIPEELRPDNG